MRVNIILFLTLCSVVVSGQVRQPHSLYFMNTVPQVSQMNPAFHPRANAYVLLPANVNIDLLSDLAVKDIFQKQGNKWYTPVEKKYDYNKLYKSIGKKAAMFNERIDLDIIGFGFRAGISYFSFGISEHLSGNFSLPKDMFKITENFFPDKTRLDFSPIRTQLIIYKQINIGYSGKINDQLTIGVNVKPIFGHFAMATDIKQFQLSTGEKQWDLDVEGKIYTSGAIEKITTNAEGKIDEWDDIKMRDFDNYTSRDWIKNYGTSLRNPGIAFDFGAIYQIDEQITVSASLNNLGFISWKKDLNGITLKDKYHFKGLEYDTSNDNDNFFNDLFKNLADSIAHGVSYRVQHDKFKTTLAPVLHAGASYYLNNAVSVGFLSRSVFWKNGVRQSFNTSLCLQPYSFVAMNVGVTWQVKGNVYLGGGFMFLLGPLQFYLLTDYAPVHYSTIRIDDGEKYPVPERQKSLTVRTGLNLIFGRHGNTNKPMLDKGKSSWN